MNILIVSFLKIKMKGLVFVNEVGIYLSLDLRMVYVSQLYVVKMFLNEFLGYEIQYVFNVTGNYFLDLNKTFQENQIAYGGYLNLREVKMKISVDYSEVYQASVYVKNKADSYNDLIQNLYKTVEQMQSIWQGVDHLAFQNQLEEFRPSLNEMYQVIQEYSNVLKQTASVYEQLQQDRVAQARLLL